MIGLVKNGIYWNHRVGLSSCENPFPITYNMDLMGAPVRGNDDYSVAAKALAPNVIYRVETVSCGSAHSVEEFMVTAQGSVENIHWDDER